MSERIIKWGIVLLVALIPLIFVADGYRSYNVIKVSTAGVIVLFLTLLWLSRMNETDTFHLAGNPLNLPLAIFYIVALLSLLRTTNLYEGLKGLAELSIYIFFFLLVVNHLKKEETVALIFDLIIFSASLASIYDIWVNKGIDFTTARDLHLSSFGHPNFAAQYLVIAIPLTISRFLISPTLLRKYLYLTCLLVMTLFLLLTKTRGAWLALAVSLPLMFILLIWQQRKIGRKKIIFSKGTVAAVILAILVLSLILLLPPQGLLFGKSHPLLVRAISTFDLSDYSVKVRLNLWQDVLKMAAHRPILGWGIGNFKVAHHLFRTLAERQATGEGIIFGEAHNDFLHLWVELGIFGLLAFIWLLLTALKMGKRLMAELKDNYRGLTTLGVLTAIIGTIVHAFFSSNLQIPATALTFWLMMGILAVNYNQEIASLGSERPIGRKRRNKFRYMGIWALEIGMVFIILPFFIQPLISDYYLQKGIEQSLNRNFPDALSAFNRSLKFEPQNIRAHFEQAEVLRGLRKFDQAIASYQRTQHLFPFYEPIYNNLGASYAEEKKYVEAEKEFLKATEINPLSYSGHLNLAWLYHLTGRTAEAEKQFIQALDLDKNWLLDAYPKLKAIYERGGRYGRFLEYAKAHYFLQKAISNRRMAMDKEAISNLNQAIEANPNLSDAYIWLIPLYVYYYKDEVLKDSIDPIARAIELKFKIEGLYPEEKWLYLIEGYRDFRHGEYQKARDKYKQALEIDPHFKWAFYELGRTYSPEENKPLATQAFKKALQSDPRDKIDYPKNEAVLEELRSLK